MTDKQPLDYPLPDEQIPRHERRPAEPTDGALVCAFLFGAVGMAVGWICCYLYMNL